MKIATSGYFILLHQGHIELFEKASKIGKLIVIVNNDKQQILKYGKVIVPLEERMKIIKAIRYVDKVIACIDDDRSVCKTLKKLKPDIFANGGDRTHDNIPEYKMCEDLGIKMIFNIGKKIQSSSNLINKVEK